MKKHLQLGMNAGTASGRLLKDILFKFVSDAGHVCFRCGGAMKREDFSIEHKEPWLDSADPTGLFLNLENIAFSHRACNYRAGRLNPPNKKYASPKERKAAFDASRVRVYDPERRRDQYLRTGT